MNSKIYPTNDTIIKQIDEIVMINMYRMNPDKGLMKETLAKIIKELSDLHSQLGDTYEYQDKKPVE